MRAFQRQNGKESEKLFKGIGLTEMVLFKEERERALERRFEIKKQGESQ
jgi:hypothetical protein